MSVLDLVLGRGTPEAPGAEVIAPQAGPRIAIAGALAVLCPGLEAVLRQTLVASRSPVPSVVDVLYTRDSATADSPRVEVICHYDRQAAPRSFSCSRILDAGIAELSPTRAGNIIENAVVFCLDGCLERRLRDAEDALAPRTAAERAMELTLQHDYIYRPPAVNPVPPSPPVYAGGWFPLRNPAVADPCVYDPVSFNWTGEGAGCAVPAARRCRRITQRWDSGAAVTLAEGAPVEVVRGDLCGNAVVLEVRNPHNGMLDTRCTIGEAQGADWRRQVAGGLRYLADRLEGLTAATAPGLAPEAPEPPRLRGLV